MATKEELNKKYFTKDGLLFIETKIKTMIGLLNKGEFPVGVKILGFGDLVVEDPQEMIGRIIELCELIDFKMNIRITEINENERYHINY